MNHTEGVTRFADVHMTTKCTLLETYINSAIYCNQLPELMTRKACRTNKTDYKQNKNILPDDNFSKCQFFLGHMKKYGNTSFLKLFQLIC